LQDYGLSRFVNIGQKGGGNYLKENKTWAKTTIAHNTLSLNQEIHFKGEYAVGSQHHSELHVYDDSRPEVQVVSATETNAYPGTKMHRTMVMIKDENFTKPFLLDIMKVATNAKQDYDLPYYFLGQIISTNFEYASPSTLVPLGKKNGYQHLYLEGQGQPSTDNTKLSWLTEGKFYTLTSATNTTDELLFTRMGANDPEFNIRREAALIIRRNDTQDTTFATVIEPHGSYSPVTEASLDSSSNIANLAVVHDDEQYTAIQITDLSGNVQLFILANLDAKASTTHRLKIADTTYDWTGAFYYH
jgi:hypothetical protein